MMMMNKSECENSGNVWFDDKCFLKKSDNLGIGKHNMIPNKYFDALELATGVAIENEHTDSTEKALAIAKDHLAEIPDYYSRLIRMEMEAGVKN